MRAVVTRAAVVFCLLGTNSNLVLGQTAPGNFDGDATITLEDHRALIDCLAGPGTAPLGERCAVGDFDCDGDVDLRDWRWIQSYFDGTPPLAAGCCESSAEELLSAAASNPVASAAFQDSWRLATELGFAPALYSVVRCEMSDGLTSYTAALGSANGLAVISLFLGAGSDGAWAPIMLATGSSSVKVFDASGGLLMEGIGTSLPTITELDANGNPVDSLSLASLSDVSAGSQGCVDYFNACFKQAGADILAEILGHAVGELALVGACNLIPGAGLVCDAAALTLLGLNGSKAVAQIAFAIPHCLQALTNGDYRCADQVCSCSSYGTCRRNGTALVCEGVGDRCRDHVSSDLRCKVDTTQAKGFRCDLSVCGDGIPDPLSARNATSLKPRMMGAAFRRFSRIRHSMVRASLPLPESEDSHTTASTRVAEINSDAMILPAPPGQTVDPRNATTGIKLLATGVGPIVRARLWSRRCLLGAVGQARFWQPEENGRLIVSSSSR